ncbi:hypothetical protein A3B60_02225 [Candidatus Peregrinibacteria bacterium RIFCSPLOWO2_01_FULL_39_12]|nr:MAG: hypothetical protein A3B60_02225 [Candidatus Peregrinibacteria bacterium RIFCSPLOWO2_01_FULL_39_12]
MKKFIAKLVLYTIISITLALVNYAGSITMADTPTQEMATALQKAIDNPCVKLTELDKGYIITKIEEPLEIAENESDPDFKQRKCYRHTLQFRDKQLESVETLTELSKEACPLENAEALADSSIDEFKILYTCREIQVILSKGGTSMIYGYIAMIYQWGASIVGIIAVTVIVFSGIQISAAGGDPEAVTSAKKRILQSLAGIAVLFLSGLILYTINPNFFTK